MDMQQDGVGAAVEEELGEADLPCVICSSNIFTRSNELLICKGSMCKIVVHQDCYGSYNWTPGRDWYCKRCEPFSTIRASKVKCTYCPRKDGPFQPTNVDEGWSHVVCAVLHPDLSFDNQSNTSGGVVRPRGRVDATRVRPEKIGQAGCVCCVEEGRGQEAQVGISVQCSAEGCQKRMHGSCAHRRGLVKIGPPVLGGARPAVLCPAHHAESEGKGKGKAASSSKSEGHKSAKGDGTAKQSKDARVAALQKQRSLSGSPRPEDADAASGEPAVKKMKPAKAFSGSERERSSTGTAGGSSVSTHPTHGGSGGTSAGGDGGEFTCELCGKGFKSVNAMRGHMRIHSVSEEQQGDGAAAASATHKPPKHKKQSAIDRMDEREEEAESIPTPAPQAEDVQPRREKKRHRIRHDASAHPFFATSEEVFPSQSSVAQEMTSRKEEIAGILMDHMGDQSEIQAARMLLRIEALQNDTGKIMGEVKDLLVKKNNLSARLQSLRDASGGAASEQTTHHASDAHSTEENVRNLQHGLVYVLNSLVGGHAAPLHPVELDVALSSVLAAIRNNPDEEDRKAVIVNALKNR